MQQSWTSRPAVTDAIASPQYVDVANPLRLSTDLRFAPLLREPSIGSEQGMPRLRWRVLTSCRQALESARART
jgi:hypothetical protein